MYCPSCGTELTQEMSYCNRCGASLKAIENQPAAPVQRVNATGAAWAISIAVAIITFGGFGMIFSLIRTIVSRGQSLNEEAVMLTIAALMAILIVDFLLIRQLPRLFNLLPAKSEKEESQKSWRGRQELSGKPAPQIVAPREPGSSVTEHTTRTFEPVYRERNTQR